MNSRASSPSPAAGFTLLEVMTVIFILAILLVMLLPVVGSVRSRLAKAKCLKNLQNLHVAASLYVKDHSVWPQITPSADPARGDSAGRWMAALQPYGIEQIHWICPTIQGLYSSPDLTNPINCRIDYFGAHFGTRRQEPFEPLKGPADQTIPPPWFIEAADVHGNGHLIVFADGHVQELGDFRNSLTKPSGSP